MTVIDSRCGEDFAVFQRREGADAIAPQFDACASWWTQVLTKPMDRRSTLYITVRFSATQAVQYLPSGRQQWHPFVAYSAAYAFPMKRWLFRDGTH